VFEFDRSTRSRKTDRFLKRGQATAALGARPEIDMDRRERVLDGTP